MLTLDGSEGEGGGQILRSSLALSMITGTPFRIDKIRARRAKPGLLRQHLTAVQAAGEVCGAQMLGASLGSSRLDFIPGPIKPGAYTFAIGTAGSASLVLQSVLPALMLANGPSKLTLEGGTHNSKAPPFDFLAKTFLPLLARMGPRVTATLERHGFYPAGGGRFTVSIEPTSKLMPLDLIERGDLREIRVRALVAQLPREVGQREVSTAVSTLGYPNLVTAVEDIPSPSGPGNVLLVEVASAHVTEVISAYGEKGKPAEDVGAEAAREARHYLDSEVPVGEHLADQLMLPMALAGAGRYRTVEPSLHSKTNIETIAAFLPVRLKAMPMCSRTWEVTCM